MPKVISDEEKAEMQEVYDEHNSLAKTAEITGHARSTVRKYVDRDKESEEETVSDGGASANGSDNGELTGMPITETPFGSQGPTSTMFQPGELDSLGYGEFIEAFFDKLEIGVKGDFVQLLSNMCDLREKIPDKDTLSYMLLQHNSQIGNANDANMIAEIYDDAKDRYLQANGANGQNAVIQNGQWVNGTQGNQQNQQPQQGSWMGGPSSGPQQPQQSPQQQGMFGMNPQQPQPQQNDGTQQMAQMFQQMMQQQQQMMQQQAERTEKLFREFADGDEQSGSESFVDQIKQVAEMQQVLDQLNGSGEDQKIDQIRSEMHQQINALQQSLSQDSGSPGMDPSTFGDTNTALLAMLANQDGMDPNTLANLAADIGITTDPEVKKLELENKKMEAKSSNRQELINTVFDRVDGMLSNGSLVETALDISESSEEKQREAQRQRQEQAEQAEQAEQDVDAEKTSAQARIEALSSDDPMPEPERAEEPVTEEQPPDESDITVASEPIDPPNSDPSPNHGGGGGGGGGGVPDGEAVEAAHEPITAEDIDDMGWHDLTSLAGKHGLMEYGDNTEDLKERLKDNLDVIGGGSNE